MRSSSRSIGIPRKLELGQRRLAADGRGELAVDRRPRLGRRARLQQLDEVLGRGAVEILVEIVVDLDDRRVDAGAEALDLGEGELAVGRRLADADAERLPAGG